MAASLPDSRNNATTNNKSFRAPQAPYKPGNFRWGQMYGLGSYSQVLRATLKETGQDYALKIMNKEHILRENKVNYVKMERMILDSLDHPGVVRLMFTFQDADSLYMGMECCDGGELFRQIQLKGRLSLDEARFYAAELVDVLEYIHEQGLIHRDVKPENILLTSEGHLKLIDFGSAKMLKPLPNGVFVQSDDAKPKGTFVGTAEYVSPEVLNSHPVTLGADLWALGCVIYIMLEGKAPFKAASEYLCFQKVMARQFEMPSHFPPAAKDLINRLLDLVPEKRPGAGPLGYAGLKSHPFFHGIDWSRVREATPPVLAKDDLSKGLDDDFTDHEFIDDGIHVSEWEAALMGVGRRIEPTDFTASPGSSVSQGSNASSDNEAVCGPRLVSTPELLYKDVSQSSNASSGEGAVYRPRSGSVPELLYKDAVSEIAGRLKSIPSFAEDGGTSAYRLSSTNSRLQKGSTISDDCHEPHWQDFLSPGETLIATSLVKKHRGFSTKKRQLMLTDKPRLFYVDPVKMIQMGEIEWSANLSLRVENAFKFSIRTPNRRYNLEELKGQAWQWKQAIDDLQQQQCALCK